MAWEDTINCAGRHLDRDLSVIPEASADVIQTAYEIAVWVAENEQALLYLAALAGAPFAATAVAALLGASEVVVDLILAIIIAFGVYLLLDVLYWLASCSADPSV